MTAAAGTLGRSAPTIDRLRHRLSAVPLSPSEGWVSVLLVAVMSLCVAWSIDDAAWVLGRDKLTDFLAPASLLGALAGFVGAKVGWPRWLTHVIGAIFGALTLALIVGTVLAPGAPPWVLFDTTARSVVAAWTDLAILGRVVTAQYGHYLLVLGVIAWGTGQFASAAFFGHRRPLDTIIVVGIVLLANMALTFHDQLRLLILYSVCALLLLIRSHALEEQAIWLRRHIGDPSAVRGLYLRGGAAFIAVAILGALTLTVSASSAPLQGLWTDLPQHLVDIGQMLQRYLPTGGSQRDIGTGGFGPNAAISGVWTTDSGTAFTAKFPAGQRRKFYWEAVAYQRFDLTAWSIGPTTPISRAAGTAMLAGQAEDPGLLAGRDRLEVTIQPHAYRGELVLAPAGLYSVDQAATIDLLGKEGWFADAKRTGARPYTVLALIPKVGDQDPAGLTQNRLRAAGTAYPAEIRALYMGVPDGSLGPYSQKLLDTIKKLVPSPSDPYDVAITTRDYLRSSANFTYNTDVRFLDCQGVSAVECFAHYRRGYCMYYATTMAVLLREMGYPARLVQGYLPGTRTVTGQETVSNASAHAWVQMYFPAFGWVDFDPTGAVAQDSPLPAGAPVPTIGPGSSLSNLNERRTPRPIDEPGGLGAGTIKPKPPSGGPFMLIGLLLVVAAASLAFVAWRRGPRGALDPDVAWRGLQRLAARLGFAPRPTQTVYEFAGALGDELPVIRPELQTVAHAKVEVAYGRKILDAGRLRDLSDANRRIRLNLLRLVIPRRARHRGRNRRPL